MRLLLLVVFIFSQILDIGCKAFSSIIIDSYSRRIELSASQYQSTEREREANIERLAKKNRIALEVKDASFLIHLKPNLPTPSNWNLIIKTPFLSKIEVLVFEDERIVRRERWGDNFRSPRRWIQSSDYVLPIKLNTGIETTLFVTFDKTIFSGSEVWLQDERSFQETVMANHKVDLILFGASLGSLVVFALTLLGRPSSLYLLLSNLSVLGALNLLNNSFEIVSVPGLGTARWVGYLFFFVTASVFLFLGVTQSKKIFFARPSNFQNSGDAQLKTSSVVSIATPVIFLIVCWLINISVSLGVLPSGALSLLLPLFFFQLFIQIVSLKLSIPKIETSAKVSKSTIPEYNSEKKPDINSIDQQKMFEEERLSSLGVLTNGLAHELNNPLAIITGHQHRLVTLLDQNDLTKESGTHSLEKIGKAVKRILSIVEALKAYSLDDSKSKELAQANFSETTQFALDLCRERLKSMGIYLTTQPIPNIFINCHQGQIIQVILNILENAIDAVSANDNKQISIEFEQTATFIKIAIIDNGPGIPLGAQKKIFDPFFTTKEGHKGLGLSVATGILSVHKGSVYQDT